MIKLPPRPRLIRYALAALAVVLIGIASWYFFMRDDKKPQFVTATASVADIEQAVLATGTLQAFQQVSVGAQASGQVKSLKVKLGDVVKKGQLVAEIDALRQQNELRNAEASINNVRAQLSARQASLRQAELAYRRQQEMLAADATSRESFEAAEATLNTSRADIKALEAQIAQAQLSVSTAQLNLGYTKILAPIDGVVVAIVTQEGQTVNANQSAPTIIKLAKLDTVTVKAQISEADVVRVKAGQDVYFTILGEPNRRYRTKLREVEPAPDSIATETSATSSSASTQAIYYNGLMDVPNPDGKLRISMTAQVNIVLASARQVVVIPAAALGERDREGNVTVRVIGEDGKPVPRKVKVGINNNVNAQITEGLAAGEKVVISEAPAAGQQQQPQRQPRMRL
ncbi:MAG: efflux RND transporter periplasmic adaptor subunit [Burkholderiaceae bacterium]